MHQLDAQIGQIPRAQVLVHHLRRQRVHRLGFLHQRADHVHLPPLLHLAAQKAVHALPLVLRHDAGLDPLAPRRQLVDDGDVQIAVEDQRQRARNRRGRHHQHVGRFALAAQLGALAHAEAVLLVCDGQAQVPVFHALGDQRVGADDHVPLAAGDGLVGDAVLLLRQAPHQQPRLHAQRLQHRLRALVVLAGQHLGGSHQRRLIAAAHRKSDRAEGHGGLAAAHVALHHARHGVGCTHVACNLLKHALLRTGGRKGHLIPVFFQIGLVGRDLYAGLSAVAAQRDGHLIEQQLLEGDAPPGRLQRLPAVREMGVAHGEVAFAQAVLPADGLGQLVGPLALAHLQRRLHALPNGLGRNAADAAVHRNQARLLLDGGTAELK